MQYIETENKVVDMEGNVVAYIGDPNNLGNALNPPTPPVIPMPEPETQPEPSSS